VHSLLRDIVDRLSPAASRACIKRDQDKLLGHDHGPYIWVGAPDIPSFMFGVESGLYPLLFAHLNPGTPVFVIEQDAVLAACFRDSLARAALPNVCILNTVADGIAAMRSHSGPLGVVHISLDYAESGFLQNVRDLCSPHVLFGEYMESRIDSLTLYEISRQAADHFHWRNRTNNGMVAGCRTPGPLLSIVVPAYNVANVLNRCLSSLADQPLESLEIIAVDDGSRDGSGEICDGWAATDRRFKVVHQANAGCAAARNTGLRAATGIYVGFVDGDDWVHPNMFPALLEAAVRTGSDLAQCGYQEVVADDDTIVLEARSASPPPSRPSDLQVVDPRKMLVSRPTIWRRIYRRDFLKAQGIEFAATLRRFDDLPFQFATLALANQMAVIEDPFYSYRQQRPGQDIAIEDERLYVHFAIFQILRAFLDVHYSLALEKQFKQVQIATHYWGSTRIRSNLRRKYLEAAAYDIFENNISLGPLAIFGLIARDSPGLLPWLLGLLPKRHGESMWRNLVQHNDSSD
jgi:glycosyltransferase involved in cell wall biosynthesis